MNKSTTPYGDTWTFARGKDSSAPRLIRVRENLDPKNLASKLPHLLRVSWSMLDETEMGLPSDQETDELECFENELVPRVERSGSCVLAAVITEKSKRHWYFYLNDAQFFSNELHDVPQKNEPYPVEVTLHKDEGWNLFQELVGSCKEIECAFLITRINTCNRGRGHGWGQALVWFVFLAWLIQSGWD